MKQDNLALFVGLFRMPYTDIARSFFSLRPMYLKNSEVLPSREHSSRH